MLPWAAASAVAIGILVGVAGGGARGGLVVGLLGLVFAGFAASVSVARCPACGGSLGRLRERAGERRCRRCGVRFE